MRGKRFLIGLRAALAIFTVSLSVTNTWAATNWHEKVLHSFNGADGGGPEAGLIFDAAGNLYGTSAFGGAYSAGTVFELTPAAGGGWMEKVLHNFGNGTDGALPYAGLIFDAAGNLYGATYAGGTYDNCPSSGTCGTVFELTPAAGGVWTETVLHNFNNNGTDGSNPLGGLIFDAAGNLYGTTAYGGDNCAPGGCGTAFELTPAAGGGWTETVLHGFHCTGTDGCLPYAGLIFDAAGNLYGTTWGGGIDGHGTVFELTPADGGVWTEQVLYSFCTQNNDCADGTYPYASLILDAAGNLYGTTSSGGTNFYGTVFELTPTEGGGWTETVLHSFGNGTDGAHLYAGLIFDAAGNLYGTSNDGGTYNNGTVFELTPTGGGAWMETRRYSFNGYESDGFYPEAGLIFDAAGNLYGTTVNGGTNNQGTAFELTLIYPCAVCSHSVLR